MLVLLCTCTLGAVDRSFLEVHSQKKMSRQKRLNVPIAPLVGVEYNVQSKKYSINKAGKTSRSVAWGSYQDSVATVGWGILNINTDSRASGLRQSFAAGYLEGYLTNAHIYQMFQNAKTLHEDRNMAGLYKFFLTQDKHLRSKCQQTGQVEGSAYWTQVAHQVAQLDGLVEGYNKFCPPAHRLSLGDFWLLNMDGDASDVERALGGGQVSAETGRGSQADKASHRIVLNDAAGDAAAAGGRFQETGAELRLPAASSRAAWDALQQGSFDALRQTARKLHFTERSASLSPALPPASAPRAAASASAAAAAVGGGRGRLSGESDEQWWQRVNRRGHCSALIKLLDDGDVLAGHTTWADYGELLRLYKHYHMPLPGAKAKRISFSSYPGMISSTDDYYIMDSGLLVTETTTAIGDNTPFARIAADVGVSSWVRAMAANRLAGSGRQWVEAFAHQNGGTYNCDWMVVDYNKIPAKGAMPGKGALWVLGQMPELVEARDMTSVLLSKRFFSSQNRPIFPAVRQQGHYPAETNVEGQDFFSYDNNPRGKIFQRDQGKVTDLMGMRKLMRYNDYKSDPLSLGNPAYAISSRGDLSTPPIFNGGIDSKVAGKADVQALRCFAQVGPTTTNGLPVFEFPSSFISVRQGVPNRFDFPWVKMQPAP